MLAHEFLHVAQKDGSAGAWDLWHKIKSLIEPEELAKLHDLLDSHGYASDDFESELPAFLAGDAVGGKAVFGLDELTHAQEIKHEIQRYFEEVGKLSPSSLGEGSDIELARTRRSSDSSGNSQNPETSWADVNHEVYKKSLVRTLERRKGPRYDWQRSNTGLYNYSLGGGGVKFNADNVQGIAIEEAKYIGSLRRSPFIKGSEIPDWLRKKIMGDIESEFGRMASIIGDPNNPLKEVHVIMNRPEGKFLFIDIMNKYGINGKIIIR